MPRNRIIRCPHPECGQEFETHLPAPELPIKCPRCQRKIHGWQPKNSHPILTKSTP